MTLIVHHLWRPRVLNKGVSSLNGVPPMPYRGISRSYASLVHRLLKRSSFTGSLLARIGRKRDRISSTCAVRFDIEHMLTQCITYAIERKLLFAVLWAGGHRRKTIDDLICPEVVQTLVEKHLFSIFNSIKTAASLTYSSTFMSRI